MSMMFSYHRSIGNIYSMELCVKLHDVGGSLSSSNNMEETRNSGAGEGIPFSEIGRARSPSFNAFVAPAQNAEIPDQRPSLTVHVAYPEGMADGLADSSEEEEIEDDSGEEAEVVPETQPLEGERVIPTRVEPINVARVGASVPVMTSSQPASSNSKRHSANFAPSIWHDTFLKYADSEFLEVNEIMKQEVQMHKEKVKMNLSSNDNNILQRLSLIDSIQRLSISYHFENEIDRILVHIHNDFTDKNLAIEECDLHFTALLFRLLQQKGYNISSDVFNKFKNIKGEFDEIIVVQDVEGMWSLYEAAQLRIHGEDILEEAHKFTYNKLKSITNQLSPSLAEQVNQSLVQPFHKAIPRIMARSYMSFYEKGSTHDEVLLKFAKLDFNMLQKWYQKEVGSAIKWWEKLEFSKKVPYARERITELYFWPFAMNSEPKYTTFRAVMAKVCQWMTILDDTYDVYGTIEELELLTQAIQRWDISYIASLPECFKAIFNAIVEIVDEIIELSAASGESDLVLQCLKQALSHYVQGYIDEARWCHEGYIPTYDERKVIGAATTAYQMLTIMFIALGEFATKETLHWISNNIPLIVQASSFISRLTNDLASHKFEQQREHGASAVECCMKQYGFSQEEAYEFIKKDINNCWKDMNEEYLKLIDYIPRPVLDCIVNKARVCEFLYANFGDKITDCAIMKDHIVALLLDPVVV
ncbi:(-)-germacrene D synthase-like [Arachis duranensis]|uniref:(-)-germacrene D synthase-like n=1 Tax=Arachis duranensis TaxID=130453 RepID=A0A6P4C2D1_ARADU|nr:(-)-germacrene D synthase-like [Arachis duranensis]